MLHTKTDELDAIDELDSSEDEAVVSSLELDDFACELEDFFLLDEEFFSFDAERDDEERAELEELFFSDEQDGFSSDSSEMLKGVS